MLPFWLSTGPTRSRGNTPQPTRTPGENDFENEPTVDHGVALGVERADAGHVVAEIAKLAVRRVLDHPDAAATGVPLGDLDQRRAARGRNRRPGRVVVVARDVDRLETLQFAVAAQPGNRVLDGLGHQAVVVRVDADRPDAQVRQRPEINEVARRAAEHDVARIENRVAHQIEQLVAAGGDDDLVDRDVHLGGRPAVGLEHPVEQESREAADGPPSSRIAGPPGAARIGPDGVHRHVGWFRRAGSRGR